jgi:hypothetical protein
LCRTRSFSGTRRVMRQRLSGCKDKLSLDAGEEMPSILTGGKT